MKHALIIISLFLTGTCGIWAGTGTQFSDQSEKNPDSLFSAANEKYTTGDFEAAFELYGQILELGLESSGLYYNMGNAAYRSNQLGQAVLYYEKALKIDPRNRDAQENLAFVSRYLEDKLESVPELFLKRWYRGFVSLFSLQEWSILSLIVFVIILAGVLFYIYGNRLWVKKSGFFSALVALMLFLLSISATLRRSSQFNNPERAVVVAPSVVVKSTPATSGTDLFILHEGTRVSTEEEVDGWTEIRISDGRVGWVPGKSVQHI